MQAAAACSACLLLAFTALCAVSGLTTVTTAAPLVTRPARAAVFPPPPPVVDDHEDDRGDPDDDDDNNNQDYVDDDDADDGDPVSLKSLSPDGQPVADGGPGHGNRPWYLLGLAGNVSVVHARQADFFKYLRMNVASLTGTQYDQVLVNSLVSYTPRLVLNITLLTTTTTTNNGEAVLRSLADSQDVLLELSGCPFNLVSFQSSASLLVSKTTALAVDSQRARDEQALFYLGVGAAVALVLSVGLLLCVLHSIRHPLLHPDAKQQQQPFRYTDPPTAIYTEQFVNNNKVAATPPADKRRRRSSRAAAAFTPLDDNLYPVRTEVDFMPRYLLDQEPDDVASSCYRGGGGGGGGADSPMPELTRLLQDGDEEEEDDEMDAEYIDADVIVGPRTTTRRLPTQNGPVCGVTGAASLLSDDRRRASAASGHRRPGGGRLQQQPDLVESTVSLPLLSPFYDPSLRLQPTPTASLLSGAEGGGAADAAPVSPSPSVSTTTWAPSLASTPEPPRLLPPSAVARRRPAAPYGKPPPPPRTDSLSSRSTSRRRRPLSVPAPCHLMAVRGSGSRPGSSLSYNCAATPLAPPQEVIDRDVEAVLSSLRDLTT